MAILLIGSPLFMGHTLELWEGRGYEKFKDFMDNIDENAQLEGSLPEGFAMNFTKRVMPCVQWVFLIGLIMVLIYLLYRIMNRAQKKEMSKNNRKSIESIMNELDLVQRLSARTKGIMKYLNRKNLPSTREG